MSLLFSTEKKITRGKKGSAVPSWGLETGRTLIFLFSILKRNISPYKHCKGTRSAMHIHLFCPPLLCWGRGQGWSPEAGSDSHQWAPSAVTQLDQLFWFLWWQNICLTVNPHWGYSIGNIILWRASTKYLMNTDFEQAGEKGKKDWREKELVDSTFCWQANKRWDISNVIQPYMR